MRLSIRLALRRPAPSRIPLSNGRLDERNYELVYLYEDDSALPFVAQCIQENGLVGRQFQDNPITGRSSSEVCIPNNWIHLYKLEITSFIKEYQRSYHNPLLFLVHRYIRFPYAAIYFSRFLQRAFNQRSLSSKTRIKILRHIIRKTLSNPNYHFNQITISVELHSRRVVFHPNWNTIIAQYRIALDSFLDSEDIQKGHNEDYRMAPKALQSLDRYEEEERKHTEQIRIQILIAVIAVVQVFLATLF